MVRCHDRCQIAGKTWLTPVGVTGEHTCSVVSFSCESRIQASTVTGYRRAVVDAQGAGAPANVHAEGFPGAPTPPLIPLPDKA